MGTPHTRFLSSFDPANTIHRIKMLRADPEVHDVHHIQTQKHLPSI